MDPKDLKNSEELKSNVPIDPKQQEEAVTAPDNSKLKKESVKKETEKEVKKEKADSPKKEEQTAKVKNAEVKKQEEEPTPSESKAEKVEEPKDVVEEKKEPVAETAPESKEKASVVKEEAPKEEPKAETADVKDAEVEEQKVDPIKPDGIAEKVEEPVGAVEEKKEQEEETVSEPKEEAKAETPAVKKSSTENQDTTEEKTEKETEQVVSEKIEKKKDAEVVAPKEEIKEKVPVKKEVDFSTMTQIELVNALRDLLENEKQTYIKNEVESIKSNFYKLLNIRAQENKEKFIKEGGLEEEYVGERDPYEQDIKDLLKKYRQQRIDYNKRQEGEKDLNLKEKYEIIEDIKNLINNEESINKTFHDFRELQNRWREIGLVPQAKMKDLWDTYHFHVENFYDYIKINKELRDLDLRKNLEIKIVLCEKAEELLAETSVIRAFNTLQKFHEEWREIGPVPREKKEEIWERFKAATSLINKRHQEFFESRKNEQKKNLEAKTQLCEKAEEIAGSEIKGHRDWDVKSRDLVELQKVWRTIGFAPKRDNNRIYERFRGACDKFFETKREFYSKNKEIQQNNLQLKIDLCVQAESLKDSEDWKKTTQDFINIQKKWKEVGPVPRKHSDVVWKRFRAACDYFFEKKSGHFSSVDGDQVENLELKEKLIEEVTDFKSSGDIDADLKTLKGFQRRWTEIGHVPIKKKDEVQNNFRETINKHFDDLNLDDSRKNILKFRNKVSNFAETSKGQNKMRFEREKYMTKLKQMQGDLILLENNIGFFSNSKNAESLIADVNKKIDQTKEKVEFLKNKIKIIDEYDGEE